MAEGEIPTKRATSPILRKTCASLDMIEECARGPRWGLQVPRGFVWLSFCFLFLLVFFLLDSGLRNL
jgi:hypothetical protein